MPTKTGAKIRIIVLGTGPDAEEAREIAAADADVAIAAKFTKTVTHLVIDDTVKSSEARVKKAKDEGVPVLGLAELKDLLAAEAPAEEPVAEPAPEPVAEAEPEPVAEAEPEPVAEAEPIAEAEPEPKPEPEKTVPTQAEAPKVESEPEIDVIEEPEAEKAEEVKADSSESSSSKPGLVAKLKSIFNLTGSRK